MQIDVYHDTACPWCRIGKAHLQQALEQWDGEPVEVRYHTFFLNASIPPEGYNFREYMTAKGGGQVPMEGWFDRPREMGAQVGVTFNFEKIEHAPNTLLSHRLIALAPEDQREAVIDAVYAAYFEGGRNIGDLEVLVEIASSQGMDADEVRARLETDEAEQQVLADAARGQQLGVTGVPFFVFENRYGFSGAQPPAVILQMMQQIQEETA
ncbi:MAG: DsbA family oxidoreductase [Chloroflexota bacterium]